jgi:cardiolipin synthase
MVYFSIAIDATGKLLKDLLIEKAKKGWSIRFIYDDVACWRLPQNFKKILRKAGVRFVPFMPVWIPFLNSHMNYRNHRKLVIVDGSTAYLGGSIWRSVFGKNTILRLLAGFSCCVASDCIYSLQAIFLLDWFFCEQEKTFWILNSLNIILIDRIMGIP